METILKKRGEGKTFDLIKISAETGEYIVCRNPYFVANEARKIGVSIPFPLTYDEFLRGQYYGKGVIGLLIDDVDELVNRIANVPVNAITLNIS